MDETLIRRAARRAYDAAHPKSMQFHEQPSPVQKKWMRIARAALSVI